MPYQVWKCSICHKECENKREAVECEQQPPDPIDFKVGDVVLVETEYEQPQPDDFKGYWCGGPIIKETVERTVVGVEQGCCEHTPDGGMHEWFLVLDQEISELQTDDEGNEYFETTDMICQTSATKK